MKEYKNKKWLKNQYTNLKKSSCKIAEECDCSHVTILNWMKKFNILRRTLSEARLGKEPWNKGKKQPQTTGNKNPMWKGNNVGYRALHDWVNDHKPKSEFCEICGVDSRLDLASKTHKYTRDLGEYQWLCKSCHIKYDIKHGLRPNPINNLIKGRLSKQKGSVSH